MLWCTEEIIDLTTHVPLTEPAKFGLGLGWIGLVGLHAQIWLQIHRIIWFSILNEICGFTESFFDRVLCHYLLNSYMSKRDRVSLVHVPRALPLVDRIAPSFSYLKSILPHSFAFFYFKKLKKSLCLLLSSLNISLKSIRKKNYVRRFCFQM